MIDHPHWIYIVTPPCTSVAINKSEIFFYSDDSPWQEEHFKVYLEIYAFVMMFFKNQVKQLAVFCMPPIVLHFV